MHLLVYPPEGVDRDVLDRTLVPTTWLLIIMLMLLFHLVGIKFLFLSFFHIWIVFFFFILFLFFFLFHFLFLIFILLLFHIFLLFLMPFLFKIFLFLLMLIIKQWVPLILLNEQHFFTNLIFLEFKLINMLFLHNRDFDIKPTFP